MTEILTIKQMKQKLRNEENICSVCIGSGCLACRNTGVSIVNSNEEETKEILKLKIDKLHAQIEILQETITNLIRYRS